MPFAEQIIAARHESFVASLVEDGQLAQMIRGIKDESDLHREASSLHAGLTAQTLKNASWAVDAASLVFGHTILDDSVTVFLDITCDVAFEFAMWRSSSGVATLRRRKSNSENC